ncbi:MAG TPA: hypothetical protein VNT53_00695 [Pseudolysinimonas sp.]|nr:hypothetical protein [Pseudolysinimonas sp.]
MNEREPTSESHPRHRNDALGLEAIADRNGTPEMLARWEEGIRRYGHAFVAYSKLGVPQFRTGEALTTFEDLYVGSFDSHRDLCDWQMQVLGWQRGLDELRVREGIPDDVLGWNYAQIERYMGGMYTTVEAGERTHVFWA